jgi:hypothetical protein
MPTTVGIALMPTHHVNSSGFRFSRVRMPRLLSAGGKILRSPIFAWCSATSGTGNWY